jgi:hypothetical protein
MVYPNIPNGYGLIRHHFSTAGGDQHAYTLFGVKLNGTPTAGAVAAELHNDWRVYMLGQQCSDLNLLDTMATVNNGGILSQDIEVATFPGTVASVPVPVQVCALFKKTTGVLGRHFRGRLYMPGCPDNELDSTRAQWTTAFQNTLSTGSSAWLGAIQTGTTVQDMVLLHRNLTVPPTIVNVVEAELQIATQRRRNRKAAHR